MELRHIPTGNVKVNLLQALRGKNECRAFLACVFPENGKVWFVFVIN